MGSHLIRQSAKQHSVNGRDLHQMQHVCWIFVGYFSVRNLLLLGFNINLSRSTGISVVMGGMVPFALG